MCVQARGVLLRLIFIFILMSVLVAAASCSFTPLMDLIVENQTDYDLTIFIGDGQVGDASSGEQITARVSLDAGRYHIKARNAQGEIIFSEILTKKDMQEIESRVYKVIIK